MLYHHYSAQEYAEYPLVVLTPQIRSDEIRRAYFTPFGVDTDNVMLTELMSVPGKKKPPISLMRQFIKEELLPHLIRYQVQYVLCTDADYFKELSGVPKADAYLGYVLKSPHGFWIQYIPSWKTLFYDPDKVRAKIRQTMDALHDHASGCYEDPGISIIKYAEYPTNVFEIGAALEKLLAMNVPLTIDIEAFSLKHYSAGIGTISFAWNKNEGISFPVDYEAIPGATAAPYGRNVKNAPVRALLRRFFDLSKCKHIYHNISYDATVLISQLYMDNILDQDGMHQGMERILRDWECTKLISYLATNSCAGNKLGLKDQSQEYTGNYGMGDDIKDITLIPMPKLLKYNLMDNLAAWYVMEKNYPIMQKDLQEPVYKDHFKPYTLDIVQMQLTGMPVNMERVAEVETIVSNACAVALDMMKNSPIIKRFMRVLASKWANKKNAEYKVKRVTPEECPIIFNPGSSDQLQGLLFDQLQLPVISYTKTKQPSTDSDTMKALIAYTTDPDVKELLVAIQDYGLHVKVLSTFIPALRSAQRGPDGWYYLFGNYNLGGTISGRLSSSDPNLQNLPVKGTLGKLIKSCFGFPPNYAWLFGGLDFASLEDRISALTTKDPNKLKVYTDGYDGHCLRAYAYYNEQMPNIDPNSVTSINSIESLYPILRGDSKAPTFALTYKGTWITLVKNCKFSEEKAKMVEARFKDLYSVSIRWVDDKLKQASKDGYITGAFGLRVRTPLLAQTLLGTSKTPYEAEAEGRSAGNALGQSWCLLNNRASAAFMKRVRASKFKNDIRLCAHIHDAQYFIFRNDLEVLKFINKFLVEEVNWQNHPDIYHPDVGLGGEFSVFYPHWGKEWKIPNDATDDQILEVVEKAMAA